MRISQLQFERLQAVRARDGLAIQEHVRRALDQYLRQVEKDAMKQAPAPASTPEAELPGVVSQPQLAEVLSAMPLPKRKGPPKVRQR